MNFPVLWPVPKLCDLGTWHKSMLCKGASKDFQKFSKLSLYMYLCWWAEKIWWMSRAGTGSGAAGAHHGGEGSCSCRTLSRASLGQGLTKARLCVLPPDTLLSDWLAAVMLVLNQNLLMSCKYWSHFYLWERYRCQVTCLWATER